MIITILQGNTFTRNHTMFQNWRETFKISQVQLLSSLSLTKEKLSYSKITSKSLSKAGLELSFPEVQMSFLVFFCSITPQCLIYCIVVFQLSINSELCLNIKGGKPAIVNHYPL